MWRSRARLGLCAIVMALACPAAIALAWPAAVAMTWPAVPAAGSAAQPDAGTLQVSPVTFQASAVTPLTLTFTPASPPPAPVLYVTLVMPSGWKSSPPSDLACPASGCSLVAASSTQFTIELGARVPTTLTVSVLATPPGFATSSTFVADEQSAGLPLVLGSGPEAETPPVAVICPSDGLGTMTVDPASVPAATSRNFLFTYTAGSCGAGAGGVIRVTVPSGWTRPSLASGTPGSVAWTGSPPVSVVSGSTIVVPVGNLAQGSVINFTYDTAQAPGSSVPYTFAAAQAAAGEPPQALGSSPAVMVTAVTPATSPPVVTSTPPSVVTSAPSVVTSAPSVVTSAPQPQPAAPGPATMTVTPARVTAARPATLRFTYTAPAGLSSGDVVVRVPAGWTAPSGRPGQAGYASASSGLLSTSGQRITVTGVTLGRGQPLTITYAAGTAPSAAGVATFLTWQRPGGAAALAALPASPQVTVALAGAAQGQPINWRPLLLVVAGLVLVAGTAALTAFRPLRRGGHGAAAGNVRAVPHTGPPPSVAVRDTGNTPPLTVRIEPRGGDTVTTIKEGRP